MPTWLILSLIGMTGGLAAGVFGIGGGIILVPALVYWAGFSQHMATGTTVAVMLPPIGLAAAYEYYRHGNVDIRAALILAIGMFLGAWLGAVFANELNEHYLHLSFGVFICGLGLYIAFGAVKHLGWL
ncbi:MAG: sulfite exporter TauE/SafE family protein [Rhodocyclaceae bacterium]|nr:MAG: sulfite exporter TauE/SafE family protein [Rhodocyclaceae bacterium]